MTVPVQPALFTVSLWGTTCAVCGASAVQLRVHDTYRVVTHSDKPPCVIPHEEVQT